MALAAFSPSHLPLVFAAGALTAALAAAWAARLPRLALSILFLALVAGQLVRLPLPGQGGGILLSDVAVLVVIVSASIQALLKKRSLKFPIPNSQFPINAQFSNHQSLITNHQSLITIFLLWSLFTLLIRLPDLGLHNFTISLAYWLRLAAYLLLLPALIYLFRDRRLYRFAQKGLLVAVGLLVLIGFLQLIFLPNLGGLPSSYFFQKIGAGWDPHQFRLTSTWLDPNFFGAFLVTILPISGVLLWHRKRKNYFLISGFYFLSLAALLLTSSRSAAIALGVSALLILPLWIIKLRSRARLATFMSLAGLAIILASLAGIIFRDRLTGLFTLDATVVARAASLKQVWSLAAEHSLLGVGYNAYQFAALQAGLIGDFSIHSRAGADNSWLTLWVTTGLPGVLLFSAAWLMLFSLFISRWLRFEHAPSLAAAAALLALFIHSQFVNSFLYGHLLITLVVIVALALRTPLVQMTKSQ